MSPRAFVKVGGARASFTSSCRMLESDAHRLTAALVADGTLDDARVRADARATVDELRKLSRLALQEADAIVAGLVRAEA